MIQSIENFLASIKRTEAPASYVKGTEFFDFISTSCQAGKTTFSYRDFYKISLITDTGKLFYADKWILIDRPAIMFSNPLIPYAVEAISPGKEQGCFCIFNDLFLAGDGISQSLRNSPLFDIAQERVYFLDKKCFDDCRYIFEKIKAEMSQDYPTKYDVLRSYLIILVREALRMKDQSKYTSHRNSSQRIAELFLTLLERQFPISNELSPMPLRSAADFADRLSVHVNHLNRVLKTVTGRTTSELIYSRITREGVQLLQHSDYPIANIGYALGFDQPSSFTNFIKKHTGIAPLEYRR